MVRDSKSDPDEGLLVHIGSACAGALFVAVVASLPLAIRAVRAGESVPESLLAGGAVSLAVVLPLMLLRARAARGWRGLLGADPSPLIGLGIALWLAMSGIGLTVLGVALKAKTHHRGLGGATFGVLGLGTLLVCGVVAARLVGIAERLNKRGVSRRTMSIGAGLLLVGPVLAAASPLAGGESNSVRLALFDLIVLGVVTALAMSRQWFRRPAAYVALPLAVLWLVVGGYRIEGARAAGALHRAGGLSSALLEGLEIWTDRDGDGHGAHFGGYDCDEGDKDRHPGAAEVGGDGVDSDCDGSDDPKTASVAAAVVETADPVPVEEPTRQASLKLPAKPDLIVVTLDTVRADRTSAYGYERATTPNLERLASEGVLFDNAYAVASDTRRAIMPIVSGTPLSKTPRSSAEWPHIDRDARTNAERLKDAGYSTAAVSSFTWIRSDKGFAQGFDHFDERPFRTHHPERESTGEMAAKVATELYGKLSKGDAPLFLWVHLFDAHEHYVTHPGLDFGGSNSGRYDGEIAFVDRQLGVLMDVVKKGGRADRTLWLVHGSHGEGFNEHGHEGHDRELYDEMIRVPMVIAGQGVVAAKHQGAVSTLDLSPTLLSLAGAGLDGVDGVSLTPVLLGEPLSHPPVVAHAWMRTVVIDWPFKLMVKKRVEREPRLLLFDLSNDAGEQRDVAAEQPDVLQRLEKLERSLRED